jgi:hypothetical protein
MLGTSHMFSRVLTNANDPPASPQEFYLQIECNLRRRDLPHFYATSRQYIQLIQSAGMGLLLSSWIVDDELVHFFNYWALGTSADTLIAAEYSLPDNPDYAAFADLLIDETKDIVVAINPVRVKPPTRPREAGSLAVDPAPDSLYARAQYNVELKDFSEFQALVEANGVSFAQQHGWQLGDTYLGVTGGSTTFNQVWIVPQSQAASVPQKLGRAAWASLATTAPIYQVLEPTPSDPLLGSDPVGPPEVPSPPTLTTAMLSIESVKQSVELYKSRGV